MSMHRLSSCLTIILVLGLVAALPGCGEQGGAKSAPADQPPAASGADSTPEGPPAAAPTWTGDTPVGQIVAEAPTTARIFELVKIDYCCGGKSSLTDAAAERNLDVDLLLGALASARAPAKDSTAIRWDLRPLPELVEHIETTHHVFLRRELPRLEKIVATVARVHAEAHPEMAEVLEVYRTLQGELLPHLVHEEEVVFPAVRKLSKGVKTPALADALEQMRGEHDKAGAAIHTLRRLTNDYEPPEDACMLFKEMLRGLLALEKDTLAHVHLENNVLLPRCLAKR